MKTVLSLIIVAAVVWLAITNAGAITLNMFIWHFSASVALVIFISFILGFLLGVIRLAPGLWRKHSAARSSEQALSDVAAERDALKKEVLALKSKFEMSPPEVAQYARGH